MDSAVLDDVIRRLLEARKSRSGKPVQISEEEIIQICLASKDIFMHQPNLLEVNAPMKICGDPLSFSYNFLLVLFPRILHLIFAVFRTLLRV